MKPARRAEAHSSDFQAHLSPRLLARLAEIGVTQILAPGSVLIREGELDSHLFFVEDGAFDVLRAGAGSGRLAEIGAGDVVGEFAFFDNRPRAATVVARTAGRVRRLERQEVLCAFGDSPLLLQELLAALVERIRAREAKLAPVPISPADLVADLAAEALDHRAVRHPYLRRLATGDLPDLRWAMADFARQYYGYSAHFPRYLTTVISRLEAADHRAALLENLTEESGIYEDEEVDELRAHGIDPAWIVGVPHPKLFRRFQDALGVTPVPPENDAVEVVCWREMFLSVLNGSPAEAVGALGLGTETIVRTIYQPFVDAIARLDLHPSDTVFFPLHTAVDDHHQETLQRIAADFARTDGGRRDLIKGMRKALSLRSAFWDWMLERALDPTSAE
jgi:CRP-like cAMP-binding protein